MFNKRAHADTALQRPRRRRTLRYLVLSVVLLVGVVFVGALGLHSLGAASELQTAVSKIRPWVYAGQLVITAVLWLRWRDVVHWLERTERIKPSAVDPLLRARHRLVALALLIQLVVGMGLPFSILAGNSGR